VPAVGKPPVESWRRDVRPGVFASVFAVVVFLLVALMLGEIASPPLARLDAHVSAWIRMTRAPVLTTIATWVTHIADTRTMVILVPVTALVLWLLGRRSGAIVLVVTVTCGWLLGSAMQVLLHRARPIGVALIPLPATYSFPSGHALAATLYFGTLSFIALGEVRNPTLRYTLVAVFGVLAVAIGLSRVYLGVHYLGDVFAAWLLGGAVVVVAILGYFAFTQPSGE
jgi:membrane-associated phospholipid phosphatase